MRARLVNSAASCAATAFIRSRRFRRDDRGATAIEYCLLVALIALFCVGAMNSIGNTSTGSWAVMTKVMALITAKVMPESTMKIAAESMDRGVMFNNGGNAQLKPIKGSFGHTSEFTVVKSIGNTGPTWTLQYFKGPGPGTTPQELAPVLRWSRSPPNQDPGVNPPPASSSRRRPARAHFAT